MRIQPQHDDATIVLLGNFNPLIFRPGWFGKHGLIGEAEADAASIEIIHPDLCIFKTDWFHLQVDRRRFIVSTDQKPFIRLADLVVKTFKNYLSHTPSGILGINRAIHFPTSGQEALGYVGKKLAPREPWGEWGQRIDEDDSQEHGGLRALVMEQRALDDRVCGHIQAKVGPSDKVKYGVAVDINDHYEIEDPGNATDCREVASIVERGFEKSMIRASGITDQLMTLASEAQKP